MKGNLCDKQGEESARKREGQVQGLQSSSKQGRHRRPRGRRVMGGARLGEVLESGSQIRAGDTGVGASPSRLVLV